MDLRSGYPFWTVKNGLLNQFPPLESDLRCDVLVVGAGITGSLIARSINAAGHSVCVLDKRDAGWGSTSASTALLQYEIDVELQALAKQFGEAPAVAAYRACEQAIHDLGAISADVGKVEFRKQRSLYFASHWYHVNRLRNECKLRQRNGFAVKLLERSAVQSQFDIDAPVALLTDVAGQIDPYLMCHRLLGKLAKTGVRVHDRTAIKDWRANSRGVHVRTESGLLIQSKHVILASGYESQNFLSQRVARNRSSYALVTEPVIGGLGPLKNTLVWESARPYLYMRSTSDGRLLIGGEDDKVDIALKRDLSVPRKTEKLMSKLKNLFPDKVFEVGFAWAGTFAETDDGLPFFGPHPEHGPRIHFAMAYGGNGIAYSAIGADILAAQLSGKTHPLGKLFSFARLQK